MPARLVLLDDHRVHEQGVTETARVAVRVVLADGHGLARAGVRALLERQEHIDVVGEASDGETVVALARDAAPDVVLLDVRLPGLDAVEAVRQVLADAGAPVLLLTASEDDSQNLPALRAGASGLLLKDADPAELVRAVDILAAGGALLSPSLMRRVVAEVAERPAPLRAAQQPAGGLTTREIEVVALVALGLGNAEIAERLVVSPATARTHVGRAMRKVRARDRAELVVFAYEVGLVSRPTPPEPTRNRSTRPERTVKWN